MPERNLSAGANTTANASIDNGSFDPDSGDTITVTQTPAGPYPIGETSVTLMVEDNHGASSSCQASVTALYSFTGFFAPIDNLPTVNLANAGSSIPVKFSLNGNKGLNSFCRRLSGVAADCVQQWLAGFRLSKRP